MPNTAANENRYSVAYINLYTEMGGGEMAVYHLVKELDRKKFRPLMIFNREGPFVDKVKSLGVDTVIVDYPVVMLKELFHPLNIARLLKGMRKLCEVFKQKNINALHCSDVLSLLLAVSSIRKLRLPVFYSMIFVYEWTRLVVFNVLALFLVKKIVVNSNLVKRDLLKRTILLRRKIEVVYLGVDTEVFRPLRHGEANLIRQELKLAAEIKLVGMVARFDPSKGQLTFLRAAMQLKQQRSDVKFLIAGGLLMADTIKPLKKYYENVIKMYTDLCLREDVIFLNHRENVDVLIRCLDVLVVPSISEGFGLVVLEGLASGIPVVVSRTVGALEVVDSEEGVFIVDAGSVFSVAGGILKALEYLHKKPYNLRRPAALSHLSWSEYTGKIEKLYLKG